MTAEELVRNHIAPHMEETAISKTKLLEYLVEFAKYHTDLGMREMASFASPFGNQGLSKYEKELLERTLNNIK